VPIPQAARRSATIGLGRRCRSQPTGGCRPTPGAIRVDELAATAPVSAWQQYSCGPGSKGPRYYHWAQIALLAEDDEERDGAHHLLIRRTPGTGELAYLRCYPPHQVPPSTLVRVAGQRWRIEESFQAANGLIGLDQHQVRRWTS